MFFCTNPRETDAEQKGFSHTASNTVSPERNRFKVLFSVSILEFPLKSVHPHSMTLSWIGLVYTLSRIVFDELNFVLSSTKFLLVRLVQWNLECLESNPVPQKYKSQQKKLWTSIEHTLNLNRTNSEPQQNKLWTSTDKPPQYKVGNLNLTNSELCWILDSFEWNKHRCTYVHLNNLF